jgi:hypothetical protein
LESEYLIEKNFHHGKTRKLYRNGFYFKGLLLDRINRIVRIFFSRLSGRKPGNPIAFGEVIHA